ncbi:hypothetical protein SSS_03020 [Sarcoptes scabiei]|uniref:Uncharacterized protein n=1 Tax=Sarcoptes scabiei TaxID=52283 RepID=A0A834R7N8_SARSC|nr:hypothetical protein SSS_03020 [Sarcoptes scabiei]
MNCVNFFWFLLVFGSILFHSNRSNAFNLSTSSSFQSRLSSIDSESKDHYDLHRKTKDFVPQKSHQSTPNDMIVIHRSAKIIQNPSDWSSKSIWDRYKSDFDQIASSSSMRHAYRNQPRSYPKQQRQPISSNSPQYHQNQHQYGTGIRAAVQTRHSIEFRDVPAQQTIHEIPIIMVGARSVPTRIVQETSSEDQPHHLIHRVSKPIIQEVFEIIRPYRKITQEVVPVQEEIQTVVARAVDNKYVPAYNQFNEKNIENPTSNAYPSSGVNQLQEPFSPVSLQSYGLIPQQLEQQPLKSIPKESDYSFLPVNSESIQSYMSPKDSDFIWKLLEPKIFSSTIENKDYGTQPSSLSKSMGTESYLFAPLSLETIFDSKKLSNSFLDSIPAPSPSISTTPYSLSSFQEPTVSTPLSGDYKTSASSYSTIDPSPLIEKKNLLDHPYSYQNHYRHFDEESLASNQLESSNQNPSVTTSMPSTIESAETSSSLSSSSSAQSVYVPIVTTPKSTSIPSSSTAATVPVTSPTTTSTLSPPITKTSLYEYETLESRFDEKNNVFENELDRMRVLEKDDQELESLMLFLTQQSDQLRHNNNNLTKIEIPNEMRREAVSNLESSTDNNNSNNNNNNNNNYHYYTDDVVSKS